MKELLVKIKGRKVFVQPNYDTGEYKLFIGEKLVGDKYLSVSGALTVAGIFCKKLITRTW